MISGIVIIPDNHFSTCSIGGVMSVRRLYTLATPRRGKEVVSGWVEAID